MDDKKRAKRTRGEAGEGDEGVMVTVGWYRTRDDISVVYVRVLLGEHGDCHCDTGHCDIGRETLAYASRHEEKAKNSFFISVDEARSDCTDVCASANHEQNDSQ